MIFRYARHTKKLNALERFYTQVIGLNKLGEFKNHNGYDGIFLGHKSADWHLEFTSSNSHTNQHFDEDDLLVFYFESQKEIDSIIRRANDFNILIVQPKNPYWIKKGIQLNDPDGYGVILTKNH